jgi:hypothetical protein
LRGGRLRLRLRLRLIVLGEVGLVFADGCRRPGLAPAGDSLSLLVQRK